LSKRGIKTRYVKLDVPLKKGKSVIEAFDKKITKGTKVIAVSHITWSTGSRLPIRKLCKLARENGIITVIDGAHALGAFNLDMTKLGCDFYATSGHKWLNGPPGTGVLYIRDARPEPSNLMPILAEDIPGIDKEPISTRLQMRGCNNTAGFAAMVDSAAFADEIGRDLIERRILNLSAYTKRRVTDTWGQAALLSPDPSPDELSSGMTSFVPSCDAAAAFMRRFIDGVVNTLWRESRIYVRSVPIPTPIAEEKIRYAIRVSTNIFNSFCEIDRLIAETSRIADALEPCGGSPSA
jgi:isopenicillin-N epimerase